MGRAPRADIAGGIYHALNRGNARHDIFFKPEDFEAFERIVAEALSKFSVNLIAYQWMKNHWHMVLSPQTDGGICLLYTSPSPRDRTRSRMPSSA